MMINYDTGERVVKNFKHDEDTIDDPDKFGYESGHIMPINYSQDFEALNGILESIENCGSYYCSGEIEMLPPIIDIENIGVLSFPIRSELVDLLVKQSHRAPFGRGTETVMDESVRKVWEIDSSKVTIQNTPQWTEFMSSLLKNIAVKLGIGSNKVIDAQLYKLLVYDKGAFFKAHRDTEKEDGMFGTLVISLPSKHRGGDLLITHQEDIVRLSLENDTMSTFKWLAFYADCKHEVEPVEDGNRVCLVFNLLRNKKKNDISQEQEDKEEEVKRPEITLNEMVQQSNEKVELVCKEIERLYEKGYDMFVYGYQHSYTKKSYKLEWLKGRDATATYLLMQACNRMGYDCYIGLMRLYETYATDELGYDNSIFRKELEITMSELVEAISGLPIQTTEFIIDGNAQLFPVNCINELVSRESHSEATGNQGVEHSELYHSNGLVIVKKGTYRTLSFKESFNKLQQFINDIVSSNKNNKDISPYQLDNSQYLQIIESMKLFWLGVFDQPKRLFYYTNHDEYITLFEPICQLIKNIFRENTTNVANNRLLYTIFFSIAKQIECPINTYFDIFELLGNTISSLAKYHIIKEKLFRGKIYKFDEKLIFLLYIIENNLEKNQWNQFFKDLNNENNMLPEKVKEYDFGYMNKNPLDVLKLVNLVLVNNSKNLIKNQLWMSKYTLSTIRSVTHYQYQFKNPIEWHQYHLENPNLLSLVQVQSLVESWFSLRDIKDNSNSLFHHLDIFLSFLKYLEKGRYLNQYIEHLINLDNKMNNNIPVPTLIHTLDQFLTQSEYQDIENNDENRKNDIQNMKNDWELISNSIEQLINPFYPNHLLMISKLII